MAGASVRSRGLSEQELQAFRDALAAGRRPKVVFTESAGQIAGQLGQVVALTDPAVSDEWVVVKFGRDELPFSPVDLQVAPRGAAARKAAPPPPEPVPARPEPEFLIDKPVVPSARRTASGGATVQSAAMSPPATEPAAAKPAAESPATAPAPRKAARPPKPKGPAGLTVTLAYGDGEWTVAAAQGAKTLARPYVIKPAEALRMVSLVDVPGVQEAVEQIMAVERADAEREADRLRAQLAEVESRLAELRDAG
jgi:hypothetical protein